jgi:hypothetical protein
VTGVSLGSAIRNDSDSAVGKALDPNGRFNMRQLARLAAMLQMLTHAENMERLQMAFDAFDLPGSLPVTAENASRVIEAYMTLFLLRALNHENPPGYWEAVKYLPEMPNWNATAAFVEAVRQSVFDSQASEVPPTLWEHCLQAVEQIAEKYPHWQNTKECLKIKKDLITMSIPGTGRVPLHEYWSGRAHGHVTYFNEKIVFLRQRGVLDDREPQHPSIIIPNYMNSPANCLAGSKYYDVCCQNECEKILSDIETNVNDYFAAPQRLAEIVAKIPSASVSAPRDLPEALLGRLDEIASHHGGVVPLHGRLFAQFLHHAFPNECIYPHAQATEDQDEWVELVDSFVSPKEARKIVDFAASNPPKLLTELPWTPEEELLMESLWLDESGAGGAAKRMVRFALVLMWGIVALVVRSYLAGKRAGDGNKPARGSYFV